MLDFSPLSMAAAAPLDVATGLEFYGAGFNLQRVTSTHMYRA